MYIANNFPAAAERGNEYRIIPTRWKQLSP